MIWRERWSMVGWMDSHPRATAAVIVVAFSICLWAAVWFRT